MALNPPSWFSEDSVLVSTAPTCGLTKGGRLLPRLNPTTGQREQEPDPETGEMVDAVNDLLLRDMLALRNGLRTDTLRDIPVSELSLRSAVPASHDRRFHEKFHSAMQTDQLDGFESATFGTLIADDRMTTIGGHGSPSADQRIGDVPYIKVSDLRAGLVNINPTNRVPRQIAEKFWKGKTSGLLPFDLLSPARTSKNIGDFCVLMPGQEQVVLTKEIIILRAGREANFDAFYLLWAVTLRIVREQWKRVVFMQTNREDVGDRWLSIEVPVPPSRDRADEVSAPFRNYYETLAAARRDLGAYLAGSSEHHFFVSGAETPAELAAAAMAAEEAEAGLVDAESSA